MQKNFIKDKDYYYPKTVGRLMVSTVPVVQGSATIGDVERLLLEKIADFETINYIYVVNAQLVLQGVISLKEVFRSSKSTLVKNLLSTAVVSVRAHTEQARVALVALKHNIKAVPVVDKDNVLLGVVPTDAILRVLNNEAVERILRLSGVTHGASIDNIMDISPLTSLRHRLPWLIFGLIGGVLTAGIVSSFEATLSKNLILAAFIPLIVYIADAVGTQTEAFIIRDLVMMPRLRFFKYLVRQLTATAIIGAVTALLLFGFSVLWYGAVPISIVLAMALFFAVLSSVLTGLIVPFVFNRWRLDPANASGPVATIIQDTISILVYFSVAAWIL